MTHCWEFWTHRSLYSSTSLMVSIGCYSTHTISMTYCSCWEYWTHRTLYSSSSLMVSIGCYSTHTQSVWPTAEITGHTEHCTHLQVWWWVLVVIPYTYNQYDLLQLLRILDTQNIVLIYKFDGQHWLLLHHTQSVWPTAENTWHTEHCTHLQVWWWVLVVIPHTQSVWPTAENTQNIVLIYKFDGQYWLLFHTHTQSVSPPTAA